MTDPDAIAFDDDSRPIATVEPEVYGDESEVDEARLAQEIAVRLVLALTSGRVGPVQVGRRCLLLKHFLLREESTTALARKLGLSPRRVRQAIRRLNLHKGFPLCG